MAVPSKKEIIDFSPINHGESEELPAYRRWDMPNLNKAMDTGLIVAVTGLRRVGKTTILKQLLGKEAFHFSFDERKYSTPETLKKVIDVFLSEQDKPLIMLDEIFRVEDWAGIIKHYHDQKRASFILSGSSALMVKQSMESLSGRLFEYYLPPLRFGEYLEMCGKKPERIVEPFKAKKRYADELERFFINGSFPEICRMGPGVARGYIRKSTVEKIVFEDIPMTFNIEHPSKLHDLAILCATNSSNLFSEVNFAEALQMSRHAVSDYLFYLGQAYLIGIIYPIGSFQKALRKQKKMFLKSASLYNALAENPTIGQAAETAVYDKLNGMGQLAFYRDPQKREVDFIQKIPIEVKYQSTIISEDMRTLLYYMQTHGNKKGILITKDVFDEKTVDGKTILLIPLDVFLLMEKMP